MVERSQRKCLAMPFLLSAQVHTIRALPRLAIRSGVEISMTWHPDASYVTFALLKRAWPVHSECGGSQRFGLPMGYVLAADMQ